MECFAMWQFPHPHVSMIGFMEKNKYDDDASAFVKIGVGCAMSQKWILWQLFLGETWEDMYPVSVAITHCLYFGVCKQIIIK